MSDLEAQPTSDYIAEKGWMEEYNSVIDSANIEKFLKFNQKVLVSLRKDITDEKSPEKLEKLNEELSSFVASEKLLKETQRHKWRWSTHFCMILPIAVIEIMSSPFFQATLAGTWLIAFARILF